MPEAVTGGNAALSIRDAREADWPQLWRIIREVLAEGDTYAFEADMDEASARAMWLESPPARTFVAVDGDGVIRATAKTGPNRPGPGSHIATASFMVARSARGLGAGRALCEHILAAARAAGYAGMQFNAVVETNVSAVALYEHLGFEIVGTVPGAFEHPTAGRVGLHIMFCRF